ncbi:unnamed protein product [[Candida] boidinii]|nr:unnamed protein product [[Candida] boidinii]
MPRRFLKSQGETEVALFKKFNVPIKVNSENQFKLGNAQPPPPLGTKRKPVFIPKPLHDPMGEYAIVLYDPTVDVIPELKEEDDKLAAAAEEERLKKEEEERLKALERPAKRHKTHRSLADILGIPKDPNEDQSKKYPNILGPKVVLWLMKWG